LASTALRTKAAVRRQRSKRLSASASDDVSFNAKTSDEEDADDEDRDVS
jgi:hypothetical protein